MPLWRATMDQCRVDAREVGPAQLRERSRQLELDDLEGAVGSGNATGADAIGEAPAQKGEVGTEGFGADDVVASADSTVEQDLDAPLDRFSNRGKRLDRAGSGGNLAAAVIRHDDTVATDLRAANGILRMLDALDDQSARPAVAQL